MMINRRIISSVILIIMLIMITSASAIAVNKIIKKSASKTSSKVQVNKALPKPASKPVSTKPTNATKPVVIAPKVVSARMSVPASLNVDDTIKAKVNVIMQPSTAKVPIIKFNVDNWSIAAIDSEGNVIALKPGTVNIKATAGNITTSAAIIINPKLLDIKISVPAKIEIGDSIKATINLAMKPIDASAPKIEYSVDNPDIAKIDNEGNIYADEVGTVNVTARVGSLTTSAAIIINPKLLDMQISVPAKIEIGDSIKANIKIEMKPSSALVPKIGYSTDNPEIAMVDNEGNIYANAVGTVNIKATVGNITTSAAITINPKLLDIKMSVPAKIEIGDSIKATVNTTMKPASAPVPKIEYSTDNPEIATVDNEGNIYANAVGIVNITARAGSLTSTAPINIEQSALKVEPRVVINGKVHEVKGYLIKGEYYFKPQDIENVMTGSSKPFKSEMIDIKTLTTATVMIDNVKYTKISNIAKTMNFSCKNDTALGAVYVWTDEMYEDNVNGDFNRAISLGLVPDNLKSDTQRQITANEFRSLLLDMIGKLEPDKAKQFEKNVTTYNKPLLRGEGFVMSYYAAACIGADTQNNNFDHSKADGSDFWDINGYEMDKLFPYIWDGPVKFSGGSNEWHDYRVASFLWSFWHSSPLSGNQVFDYDETEGSMHTKAPLTVKEAINAEVRIYDSYVAPLQYLSLTDEKAVNYDKTIITDGLLNKTKSLPTINKENMPTWKGFVLSNGGSYENTDIVETDKDLQNIANWGFNSVRIMLTYQTLFDINAQSVKLNNLKKLDALIAAAIKYNLHINLLTFSLPGRWTSTDFNTYKTIGSLDLFTNPDRQKEANAVWALLSERYRDVPSATLSFCPIWEAQNHNLSSGLVVDPYTSDDVAKVYSQLIDTIIKYSPDRFIIFEPTANNTSEVIISESQKIKDLIESKYQDVLMMVNFCDMPFVYAEMTAVQGNNIDNDNHSMFKPDYPTTIYATKYHINNGSSLDMNGGLVAGTKIDIYLSKVDGSGNFVISADGKILFSENLSTKNFRVETPLSWFYPYAKSDKLISITLTSDIKSLQIKYGGNWFEWSGIDVTLPAKYAVKRWWFMSGYDATLNGKDFAGPELKDTSTIMISPNSYDKGSTITINPDVTYTSSEILAQSNKQTIDEWAKSMSVYSPNLIIRFESAGFDIGCTEDSMLKYYDDLLSAYDKYDFSWFSNDYWRITHAQNNFYAGSKPIEYEGFPYFNADLLRLLQKHQ